MVLFRSHLVEIFYFEKSKNKLISFPNEKNFFTTLEQFHIIFVVKKFYPFHLKCQ